MKTFKGLLNIIALTISLLLYPTLNFAQRNNILFAGYNWKISDAKATVGSTNMFKKDTAMQYIDSKGRLHLKIKKIFGVYYCSEVELDTSLGYGEYRFYLETDPNVMDSRIVLSMGINSDPHKDNNVDATNGESKLEIDISRWNNPNSFNGKYVVYPILKNCIGECNSQNGGNFMQCFNISLKKNIRSIHRIIWDNSGPGKKYIKFQSFKGISTHPKDSSSYISEMNYTGVNIPFHRNDHAFISLWIYGNNRPLTRMPGDEIEVIISSFKFLPMHSTQKNISVKKKK